MPKKYYARRRKSRLATHKKTYIIIGSLAVVLTVGIILIAVALNGQPGNPNLPRNSNAVTSPKNSETKAPTKTASPSQSPSVSPSASPSVSVSTAPVATLAADLAPHPTNNGKVNTDPSALKFTTDIKVGDDDAVSSDKSTYQRKDHISFGTGSEYTSIEGVITFRGNNYRDASSWGTADIADGKLKTFNTKKTSVTGGWSGAAWTGQPLVIKWPDKTRKNMTTLYDKFKNKDGFTEVILASVDGNIYFMDLDTGEKTRDPIKLKAPTKGTPSLYPSGIPLLFVGQGLQADGNDKGHKDMYYRVVNLITGEITKLWGYVNQDPFAYRKWQAYDSSALIDTKADTLIEPGENGILYTVKLNTKYDENAGTLSIAPEKPVKYRYTTPANKSREQNLGGRWGTENSAAAWRNYLFFTDNAGIIQCVDLNTMKLVWGNDMGNDSDPSMVLEEDGAKQDFYLYTADEYDDDVVNKKPGIGDCYARKIDGLTGEIIWEHKFTCNSSNKNVDGGILASPVLGRDGTNMAGLIIYNVSTEQKEGTTRWDNTTSELVAMDKLTGEIKWHYDMKAAGWSPSSPVPVYTKDGKGYLVQCDIEGEVALIDGATGNEVNKLSLKVTGPDGKVTVRNNFEATPVVYNNTIVVASRSGNIFFIKIS